MLDANIFVADIWMSGLDHQNFWEAMSVTVNKVVVPSVVFHEVVDLYSRRLVEGIQGVKKAIQESRGVLRKSEFPMLASGYVEQVAGQYETWFKSSLESRGVEIAPYPQVEHATIVQRLLDQKRPFRGGEDGYRDFLIWKTLFGYDGCDESDDGMVLISADKKAFADARGLLHPDLASDEDVEHAYGEVRYYHSLAAFMTDNAEELGFATTEFISEFPSDDHSTIIHNAIENAINDAMRGEIIDRRIVGLSSAFDDPMIESIGEVNILMYQDTAVIRGSILISTVHCTIEVNVAFGISKSDLFEIDEREMGLLSSGWNDQYLEGEVVANIDVLVRIEYDAHAKVVSVAEVARPTLQSS